jgi:hypothetical protein
MQKLKLDLDQLVVDSFDTLLAGGGEPRGTVKAFAPTMLLTCGTCNTCGTCDPSCAGCASYNGTCYNTCGPSCYGTCATCQTNCEQESCVYYCP